MMMTIQSHLGMSGPFAGERSPPASPNYRKFKLRHYPLNDEAPAPRPEPEARALALSATAAGR